MSAEERVAFARRLRHLMSARGLTPKALCWAMGLTPDKTDRIRRWMNAASAPSYASLRALHSALGCTWEELMGE